MATNNGILVEYDWCTGCHSCEMACQMEHKFPIGQCGIKVFEVGPWEYEQDKWMLSYYPVLTDLCNLCTDRVALGKLPTCVQHCQAKCLAYGALDDLNKKMAGGSKQMLFTV